MKNFTTLILIFACILLMHSNSFGQKPNNAPVSSNAPKDKPVTFIKPADQSHEPNELIAPYVKKARKTLKKAKKKYLKGLKDGQAFFLTTKIYDKDGSSEQIFVRITKWEKNIISGTIANHLNLVQEYSYGQLIQFPKSAVLDWLITNPDGTEEGNFVGKFLDTLK